jgi:hypothetical protein
MIMSRKTLFRMRKFSVKSCKENLKKTDFTLSNFFFENHAVYEIWGKSILEGGRPQMTIWRMRFAYWIPKATNTHSGCVILIAFPQQQWLYKRTSMLRYTYIAFLFVLTTVCGCQCGAARRLESRDNSREAARSCCRSSITESEVSLSCFEDIEIWICFIPIASNPYLPKSVFHKHFNYCYKIL